MKECAYCNRCYEDGVRHCPHDGQPLADTLPGACLIDSKYQLELCVGRGGMGAVYRANHVHLRRPFAIKTILPEFASRDHKAGERFLQEARTAAAIQHPNVVAITDFGITNFGLFYYVMEHIEGGTLRDELHKNGAMHPERIYKIFKQVLAGVAAAHRLHMVHRDLKPSNIMLTKITTSADNFQLIIPLDDEPDRRDSGIQEMAKVVDFGLAKFVHDSRSHRLEASDNGGLIGSPLYMSPEQCEGSPVDERSDIYSLGVILYHMLTGEVPFKGDSLSALLTGHLLMDPPSLRGIKSEIPDKLEKVVLKALAKKPHMRYQSVAEFAEDFESAMAIYLSPVSQTVTLIVQTTPPACEVYIDDEYRGRTGVEGRLIVKGLASGKHSARVTLTGYIETRQNFTAPVGDYTLNVQLQRKDDISLVNSQPVRNTGGLQPSKRTTGRLDGYSSKLDREFDPAYRTSPPVEFSIVDVLLASVAVIMTLVLFIASNIVDPISAALGKDSSFPIQQLVGLLGILSVLGFTSAMILADQMPAHRNSSMLSSLFNFSSVVFLITIIIPLVIGFVTTFVAESENPPTNFWFAGRLIVIVCCFLIQRRIKARRRVPFLA